MTGQLTDYEKNEQANEQAHKYRWLVWGFVPAIVIIYYMLTMVFPIIRYGVTGILLQ